MARDYKNATNYEETPAQVKNREARNKARRDLEKEGRVSKGDGKDVGHKRALANGGGKVDSNVEVQTVKANRGWRRHRTGYSVPNI